MKQITKRQKQKQYGSDEEENFIMKPRNKNEGERNKKKVAKNRETENGKRR